MILGILLSLLALGLSKMEFGPRARRRRRLHQAMSAAERKRREASLPSLSGAAQGRRAALPGQLPGGYLSPADLARLDAFRPRARLMAGEPTGMRAWWRKVQLIWRGGHSGWIIAALVGAFSMATHFGAFWLITGGGWLGATVITVLSTAVMVGACAWVMLGLLSRP
ncbi:MAG: hypothetical protein M3442_14410 [Chloroflexota bacterium]|nr:hypothetical protein [Chloroflexota bacterium]